MSFTITTSSNYSDVSINDLSNQIQYIEENYTTLYNDYSYILNYDNSYSKIDYILEGSKLLINSFKSNTIIIKFELAQLLNKKNKKTKKREKSKKTNKIIK
jgi:hypothetical protein